MLGGIFPPVVAHLLADISEFSAKMGEAEAISQRVTGVAGSKMAVMGKELMGVGGVMAAASGAVIGETLHMAASFDSVMERVHTQAGASQAEVDGLKQSVLNLAMASGQGPEKLAEALYHVESVGYRGKIAMDVLTQSAHLAAISGANLDDTTYGLTSVMQTFGAHAGEASKYAALFNATVGAGDMQMEAFNRAVGTGFYATAKTFGVSAQSASGALAFLTDRGAHADEAATRLRMTIALLAAPSKKATDILTGLGLTNDEVGKSFNSVGKVLGTTNVTYSQLADDLKKPDGFYVALTHLQRALEKSGLSASAANAQLSHAFGGGKSDASILAMLNNLDNLKQKYDAVGHGMGSYAESYAAAQKTATNQMKQFSATAQALGIEIGQALMPYALVLLGWVKNIAQWMATHKGIVEGLAFALGVTFVTGLALLTAGFVMFAAATIEIWGPVLLIVLGVEALIAVIILLWKNWGTVWGWVVEKAKQVWAWLGQTWNALKADTLQIWGELLDWIKGKWTEFTGFFSSGWSDVSDTTSSWWDTITGAVKGAWDAVGSFFSSAWHTVTDPIVHAWHTIVTTTQTVWNGITTWFKKWWPLLFLIFFPMIAVLVGIWNHFHTQILNAVHIVWTLVTGFLKAQWDNIVSVATTVWGFLVSLWVGFNHLLQSVARAVWDAILGFLKGVWSAVVLTAKVAWTLFYNNVVTPVVSAAHAVGHWLSWLWDQVKYWFGIVVSIARADWNAFYAAVIQPVINAAHTVWTWMNHIGDSIRSGFGSVLDWVRNLWNEFWSIGGYIMQGLWSGITSWFGTIENGVSNFLNGMLGWAKSILGIASPSKVFADQIGQWIPKGVAVGIKAHAHVARGSIEEMAHGVIATAKVAMKPSLLMPGIDGVASAIRAAAPSMSQHAPLPVTLNVETKLDGKVVFRSMQTTALQYQKRNDAPAFTLS